MLLFLATGHIQEVDYGASLSEFFRPILPHKHTRVLIIEMGTHAHLRRYFDPAHLGFVPDPELPLAAPTPMPPTGGVPIFFIVVPALEVDAPSGDGDGVRAERLQARREEIALAKFGRIAGVELTAPVLVPIACAQASADAADGAVTAPLEQPEIDVVQVAVLLHPRVYQSKTKIVLNEERMGAHSALLSMVSAMTVRTRASSLEKTWKSTSFSSKDMIAERKRGRQGDFYGLYAGRRDVGGIPEDVSSRSLTVMPQRAQVRAGSQEYRDVAPPKRGHKSINELLCRGVLLHAISVRSLAGDFCDPTLLRQDRRDGAFGRGAVPIKPAQGRLRLMCMGRYWRPFRVCWVQLIWLMSLYVADRMM